MNNTKIKSIASMASRYEQAKDAHAEAERLLKSAQKSVRDVAERRDALRSQVVEEPALAQDKKTRQAMMEAHGEFELSGAAVEGLVVREHEASRIVENIAEQLRDRIYSLVGQMQNARVEARMTELVQLVKSWGPVPLHKLPVFEASRQAVALSCRDCVHAGEVANAIMARRLPAIEDVKAGIQMLEEFEAILVALPASGWTDSNVGETPAAESAAEPVAA